MKNVYEALVLDFILFDSNDILSTSSGNAILPDDEF